MRSFREVLNIVVNIWKDDRERLTQSGIKNKNKFNNKYPKAAFFDTRDDHEKLIIWPKMLQDNATPSGKTMGVLSLLWFFSYDGKRT
jgi:uncharacterized protein YyaL (SSP411 family)